MTRVIKNKAVVPRDYITGVAAGSIPSSLSRTETLTEDINCTNISPFDWVYEFSREYLPKTDEIELGWGHLLGDELTYKILYNITQKIIRFYRFIIYPNVYVHITKTASSTSNTYVPKPKLNITFNLTSSAGTIKTNNISISFDNYGGTFDDQYYKTKDSYSIIYDSVTNEIFDDTSNGTGIWLSEQDIAVTSDGEVNEAALDVPSSPSFLIAGASINKAVVPQDYANLIYTVTDAAAITGINTVTHDLTAIDVNSLPRYDMVGEIECVYPVGALKSISGTNRIYYITRKFDLNPELVNRYRLIRLIVQPNINFLVSIGPITLYFQVQYIIDGETYSDKILLANRFGSGSLINTGTDKYAFIFDTKTKEFYNDTINGTALWSSIY